MASINFKGKSAVWNHHLSVPYHTLEQDEKNSLKGKNDAENLIIQGDNLLALKALLPQYQGKVKCIYIDPPYNTGNESWVYSDNVSSPTIKEWQGKVVGKAGEDLTRHDKWLCMMAPRLKMLRELLAEDGAIFVSIDDNEQHRLRQLMDEVFGEENFVTQIEWQKRYTRSNNTDNFTTVVEHIIVYSRSLSFKPNLVERDQEANDRYENPDNDPRGAWKSIPFSNPLSPEERPNLVYPITQPNTGKTLVPTRKAWRSSKEIFEQLEKDNRVYWGKDGKSDTPRIKSYLSEAREGMTPINFWDYEFAGHTDNANAEIKELFDDKIFETPKPTKLIKRIIQVSSGKDAIILDSFAGSGTTAQAVLDLNKIDGGNRRFILVELEDYANKITAERVRRAVKKYKYEAGFTYHTLGQAIDAESLLTGKLPSYKEFAKYVYYLATGKNHPDESKIDEARSLVGKGDGETVYLLYKKDMDALKSLAITLDWAQETHAKDKGKKIVYAPACYLDDETLDQYNITFVSVPYNLFEKTA
jgi:adenine specific DNA methylase Mod